MFKCPHLLFMQVIAKACKCALNYQGTLRILLPNSVIEYENTTADDFLMMYPVTQEFSQANNVVRCGK